MSMPLHLGANPIALPPNRLAHQPKVNFPEAVAFREKRDMIQSKLRALLERDQNQRDSRTTESVEEQRRSSSIPSIKGSSKKPFSRSLVGSETRPPLQLPGRRKTQWDCLLQEMSWMATDFIEERKWKISSARTIASVIPTPGLAVLPISPSVRKPDATTREADARLSNISSDFKECKMETPEKVDIQEHAKRKFPSDKAKPVDQRQYPKSSMEDTKMARRVGRIISSMITELRAATREAGSMGLTDKPHTEALVRYQQNRSNLLTERAIDSQSVDTADKVQSEPSTSNKVDVNVATTKIAEEAQDVEMKEEAEEPTFDSITECINNLHKIHGNRTRSKSTAKYTANALSLEKLILSTDQKETVDFVEKLWSSSAPTGAVLVGPAASGKSMAVCTLLWKQRSKGLQMLVCPPTSVVSTSHFHRCLEENSVETNFDFSCDGNMKWIDLMT
jgi:hypothetical protein